MTKHVFLAVFLIAGLGPLLYVIVGEELGFSSLSQRELVDYAIIWVPVFGFTFWAWFYARKNPDNVKGAFKIGAFMAFAFLCGLFVFFKRVWPHL